LIHAGNASPVKQSACPLLVLVFLLVAGLMASRLLHGFLRLLHGFSGLLRGFLGLLHGFLRLVHGFFIGLPAAFGFPIAATRHTHTDTLKLRKIMPVLHVFL